jgi:hypothetical protein
LFHIHNGESTASTLREFRFPGEHFAFQEVLMAGPTPNGLSSDEWFATRARHLAEAYDLNLESCRSDLLKQEGVLQRSLEHDEVVLWFEHDLFCQINLIYLLDWFSKRSLGKTKLSLICVDSFPGVEDFRGLGQLTGEQVASLFDGRCEIGNKDFAVAARAWAAYCSADPNDIFNCLAGDTSAMPFLQNALLLHLARFPSTVNGLGLIENKALELISAGAISFKSLFPRLAKAEPVYGLGDAQFWNELRRLAECSEPLITISERDAQSNSYHTSSFELTEKGTEVLSFKRDFVELNGIDLWLGGVHLVGFAVWRWDKSNNRLMQVHNKEGV